MEQQGQVGSWIRHGISRNVYMTIQAIFTGKNSWIENFGGMRRVEDIGFGPQNLTVEVINDNEVRMVWAA